MAKQFGICSLGVAVIHSALQMGNLTNLFPYQSGLTFANKMATTKALVTCGAGLTLAGWGNSSKETHTDSGGSETVRRTGWGDLLWILGTSVAVSGVWALNKSTNLLPINSL